MANLISIQLNSSDKISKNLTKVENLVDSACNNIATGSGNPNPVIVLPECFSIFGTSKSNMLKAAEYIDEGPIQEFLSNLAKTYHAYIVGGTTPVLASETEQIADKYYAASLVYNPSGERIARYDKIHMFDVEVKDNTKAYKESASTLAGQSLSLFKTPFAEFAQSVCYDLRFADMFSAYAKYTTSGSAPEVIVVPSAFTQTTGVAHWHALLKARSIENQCYIIASNQVGTHADARRTFGHSCIYSPWGECIGMKAGDPDTQEGFAMSTFDMAYLQMIRTNMPVLSHKKERYSIGQSRS